MKIESWDMSEEYSRKPGSAGGFQRSPFGADDAVGKKLRALYKSVEDEGIPDRFLDLLEKLDEAEARQSEFKSG